MRIRPFLHLVLISLALALSATGITRADGRGWIERLLEDNLAGEDFGVDFEGIDGALSSRARVRRISFSDKAGKWLVIEGATLDWVRSDLLERRLTINELSAERILVLRLPESGKRDIATAATPNTLPDLPELPVAVLVKKLQAKRVVITPEIAAESITLALDGSIALGAGQAQASLDLKRLDQAAFFRLLAAYDKNTGRLALDLTAHEAHGGFVSRKLAIPGSPELDFTLRGEGPVDDFTTNVTLATDGIPRLGGRITLRRSGPPENRAALRFTARLGGDPRPLLDPALHPFFGERGEFLLSGRRQADGSLVIESLRLNTRALRVTGRLGLTPENRPGLIDLTAQLRPEGQKTVVLPFGNGRLRMGAGSLQLFHDRQAGRDWRLSATARQLEGAGFTLQALTVNGSGRLATTREPQLDGRLSFTLSGLDPADPALAQAVGSRISGSLAFDRGPNTPFRLRNLKIGSAGLIISGNADISDLAPGKDPHIKARIHLDANDAERFSGLTGRRMSGALAADVMADLRAASGQGVLELDISSRDLRIGQAQADAFLAGEGRMKALLRRDFKGLHLEHFAATTPAGQAEAQGFAGPDTGQLRLSLRLRDGTILMEGLAGEMRLDGTATRKGGPWQIETALRGAGRFRLDLGGTAAPAFDQLALTLTGNAPLGLLNPMIAPRRVNGTAALDLRLFGPPALAALSGNIRLSDTTMTLPRERIALRRIAGSLTIEKGQARADLAGNVLPGGRFRITGKVSLDPQGTSDLAIALARVKVTDPLRFDTILDGEIGFRGSLARGGQIGGRVTLDQTEIRLTDIGGAAGGPIPGIRHVNTPRAVRLAQLRAGLAQADTNGRAAARKPPVVHQIDVTVSALRRIFVRGRGLDAELGGALVLGGNTGRVAPSGEFRLIRGRLDLMGKHFLLTEGSLSLRGGFDPHARFIAETKTDTGRARIILEGPASHPALHFESTPELPEDEVVALILFGRSISDITPLQALRMATAIRTLAGNGSNGILDRLRGRLDLDDLSIATDEEGKTQLGFGKYISDNAYSEVIVTTEGKSRINLNLTINENLKLQGHAQSDGRSGIGLFFEKDY